MFEEILRPIRAIYNNKKVIDLHAPVLGEIEKKYLCECIDSGFVSSVGPMVTGFEKRLAEFTQSPHVISVSNGTAGLFLSLIVTGVKPGDYVITQNLTFVATANAIAQAGAKPIFLDSGKDNLGLSPEALSDFLSGQAVIKDQQCFYKKDGSRISACVPMHVFGHAVDIEGILKVCETWHIPVVEDAAEALGSYYKDQHLGTFAPCGVLSFNGNKIVTTGGGGALLFKDAKLAQKARHLATTAKMSHPWEFEHDEKAFNLRLPNINAALGLAQMDQLENFLRKKREIALQYKEFFGQRPELGVTFIDEPKNSRSNFWLNGIRFQNRELRDLFLKESNSLGIQTRPIWKLMSELSPFRDSIKVDTPNAKNYYESIVNIPSGVPIDRG